MHQPNRTRLGWMLVVGVYWVIQVLYLVSPIDLVPDIVPVFGFGDDLLGLLSGLVVTGIGVYKAFGDRLALRGADPHGVLDDTVIETTAEPAPKGFEGYAPRSGHDEYEPLTPDELKAL